ncbi:hypothetical protein Ae201684_018910 [Aphanomyces euteiches]|uniref:Uncharacterized protein n=1 Tax=Aphanomyces euteiches TaxID=100861 RepID=A0A6G0W430_9STRA|nr:hypothetical protein Ae201684_018910 [Aphanomyces euteiches]
MPKTLDSDDETPNLQVSEYSDFLDFLVWAIRKNSVESLYKDQNIALPEVYGEDMKIIFSGIRRSVALVGQYEHLDFLLIRRREKINSLICGFEQLLFVLELCTELALAVLPFQLNWYPSEEMLVSQHAPDELDAAKFSTKHCSFDHISSENDAIGFIFHKTKTSQEGTKNKDPKHCYAYPEKPSVCLFLAIAIYLGCNRGVGDTALFPGSKQKDRFGKSLGRLLGDGSDHTDDVSCSSSSKKKRDLGTHSIRKGAATFVSSGSTGGPSIVSVYCQRLFALWSVVG